MEMSPQCNVLDLSSDQFYSFIAPFVHVSDIVLFNAKYIGQNIFVPRRESYRIDLSKIRYNRLAINQRFIIQFPLNHSIQCDNLT